MSVCPSPSTYFTFLPPPSGGSILKIYTPELTFPRPMRSYIDPWVQTDDTHRHKSSSFYLRFYSIRVLKFQGKSSQLCELSIPIIAPIYLNDYLINEALPLVENYLAENYK